MSLKPNIRELMARARADLRAGVPVVLAGFGSDVLTIAAETITDARLSEFKAMGDPVLAITNRRAETLKARSYDTNLARILVPGDAGRSWIAAIADPSDDLRVPMKGPLKSERGGSARLHELAISLTKDARLLPAAVVVPAPTSFDAAAQNLTILDAEALNDILSAEIHLSDVVHARVPIAVSEAGRLHVFRPDVGGEEHYAVEIGQPARDEPVLARLHSACFTGDLLDSLKCDCGPQLRSALAAMGTEGAGVLLYLNQEGRGIGLANKMRAYSLQDQGFDTVESNHRLGFEDDERDFRIGSEILKKLGFASVRLMTNNPAKVEMMTATGVEVTERVPLKVGQNPLNARYLETKARKSGHLL